MLTLVCNHLVNVGSACHNRKVLPLRTTRFRTVATRLLVLASASVAWSLLGWFVTPTATETAVANGDTRTIHLYHTHTGESIDATFRVDGRYDQAVLDRLNYFLRDWRNNDQIAMDPRLFDTVWEVYRTAGADQPIQIYSAYRSPETNAMLRRRSRAVAEHSQHMLGKAMDTTMPGMPMERIREIAMRLQRGGVGYYQSANFVHIDVGGVRSWPRMNYDQLARLFPDGKTVHIPSNGQPMARYEEARAEIAARGGTELPPAQQSQGFFAWLFGGSGDAPRDGGAAPVQPMATAYANNTEGDEASVATGGPARREPAATQAAPEPRPTVVASASPETTAPTIMVAEPAPVDRGDAAGEVTGSLPLPPRRPMDLIVASADIPLPPTRPLAPFRLQLAAVEVSVLPAPVPRPAVDPIGGLIAAGPADAALMPSLRRANLPAIITQGSETRRSAGPALAFAATEPTIGPRAASREPVAHSPLPNRNLGLRAASAQHSQEKPAVPVAAVKLYAPPPPLAGPPIGLRRAAQALERAAL